MLKLHPKEGYQGLLNSWNIQRTVTDSSSGKIQAGEFSLVQNGKNWQIAEQLSFV